VKNRWGLWLAGGLLLFGLALVVGGTPISWKALALPSPEGQMSRILLWELRLPRVLLAGMVGALLAAAGASLQAVLRNPLADPYLLGVSSGAALGAVAGLAAGRIFPAPFAAAGAMTSLLLVLILAKRGGGVEATSLVLAGATIHSLSSSLLTLILAGQSGRPDAGGIFFWLLGSLGALPGRTLLFLGLSSATVLTALLAAAPAMNILALGDDSARALGLPAERARTLVLLLAAGAVGLAVTFNGMIPFVGLLVPHAARFLAGGDMRRVLPLSAYLGAGLLAAADAGGRWAWAPREIPTGVVTALVGAPFFLFLLWRRRTA
jgi:iron complex transport system permease protein